MTELLYTQDAYLRETEATVLGCDERGIVLDRTVFYPMGGGQPGDSGELIAADGRRIAITDTRKERESGEILHIPQAADHGLQAGDGVRAVIDWERRHRLMRTHTALHLLCTVVGAGVTGGSVGEGRGRLDFDLPEQTLDKEQLTAELNRLVSENHPLSTRWISDEEMEARPELVRTMSVQPPMGQGKVRLVEIAGIDLQPCGGTHVASTGEIGRLRIGKIEKKGKANRRVNILLEEEPAS